MVYSARVAGPVSMHERFSTYNRGLILTSRLKVKGLPLVLAVLGGWCPQLNASHNS